LAVSIFALLIGALWAFFGFRFFLILLPIWGFFVGFLAGAQGMTALFGDGFLATVTGWVVGFVLGIVFAILSYLYYWVAVVLLGGTIGYALGSGVMAALLDTTDGILVVAAGLIVAVLFGIGTALLRAPKYLVIVLSAFGGSAAIVAGALLLLDKIELGGMQYGIVAAAITVIESEIIWLIVWAVIGAAGVVYQMMSTPSIEEIDTTGYRYA
jgi:hypothetical protein